MTPPYSLLQVPCCCVEPDVGICDLPADYATSIVLRFGYNADYAGFDPDISASMVTLIEAEFDIDPESCSWRMKGSSGSVDYGWSGNTGIPSDYSSSDQLVSNSSNPVTSRVETGPFAEMAGAIPNSPSNHNFTVVGSPNSAPITERIETVVHQDSAAVLRIGATFQKPDGLTWGFAPPLSAFNDKYTSIKIVAEIYTREWYETATPSGFTRVFPDFRTIIGSSAVASPVPYNQTASSHLGGPHGIHLSTLYSQAPNWPWGAETSWTSSFLNPVPWGGANGGAWLDRRAVLYRSSKDLIVTYPSSSTYAREWHKWAYAQSSGWIEGNYSDVEYTLEINYPSQ